MAGGVDDVFRDLRQGDFVQQPCALQVQTNVTNGNTEGVDCEGLIIISQSCDLTRPYAREPYVQVARLFTEADPAKRKVLMGEHTPTKIPVPHRDDLFIDLTVVATMDKEALADLDWTRPIETSQDAEEFAQALGRKISRFAFPDEFQDAIKRFRDRVRKKHDKDSPEGRAWANVRQIRATATDDWTDNEYDVTVTFVLDPPALPIGFDDVQISDETLAEIDDMDINQLCEAIEDPTKPNLRATLWERLVNAWIEEGPGHPNVTIDAEAISADDYPIVDYWESRRLDLDYLSDDDLKADEG